MYLVTGASGNVGSEVVEQLLESGEKVRVFVRDPGKVAQWGDRVEVAVGDFGAPERFAAAVAGAEGVFLMNGGDTESFRQLIAAAKTQGRPRIVFLSTIAASVPGLLIGEMHKEKEDAIRASGLPGTYVRPGGFMSNAYQWIGSIKAEGAVYHATGAGKSAPIAPEDIAAVAVKALTTAGFADQVLELSGGELISVPEQVGILASLLGKPIRCVDVTTEAAVQRLVDAGVPAPIAKGIGQSFDMVRNGQLATIKDTVARVTGKPPMRFEAWAHRHVARFD